MRTRKTALERIDSPLGDEKAIREAVVNAIVHNDYTREVPPKIELFANRLEITSYGRLPEGLSRDDFFSGVSVPRNKELMRVFRDLELVESLGSGMTYIMKKYGRDNFQFLDNFIRISIPYNPVLEHETINGGINGGINDGINGAIKKAIADNAGIDVARLVAVLGKSRRTIERAIARLKQQGVIEYRGSKKTGGYCKL